MNIVAFWKYVVEYNNHRARADDKDASFAIYLPTGRVMGVISTDGKNDHGNPVVRLTQVLARHKNYDGSEPSLLIDVEAIIAIERLGTAHLELSGDFKLDPAGELAHAVRGVVKGYFNPEGPV